jgi:hypothetical protein
MVGLGDVVRAEGGAECLKNGMEDLTNGQPRAVVKSAGIGRMKLDEDSDDSGNLNVLPHVATDDALEMSGHSLNRWRCSHFGGWSNAQRRFRRVSHLNSNGARFDDQRYGW